MQTKLATWQVNVKQFKISKEVLAISYIGSLTSGRRKRQAVLERPEREAGNETSKEDDSEPEAEPEAKASGEEEQFACIKAMAAGKIFRSCVPKITSVNLNCTSVLGQNALCYCHTDACNKSPYITASFWMVINSIVLAYANTYKQ